MAFSENPIIVKATSVAAGMKDVRMPRVVCEVTCDGHTEELVYVVSAQSPVATFNLSDALNGILLHGEEFVIENGLPKKVGDVVHNYTYKCYDLYFYNGRLVNGSEAGSGSALLATGEGQVQVGGLSDFRRLHGGAPSDWLSLKSEAFGPEHIVRGFPYPITRIDGKRQLLPPVGRTVHVVDYNPHMTHPIIFRNSFGELEGCVAWCRERETFKADSVQYTRLAANDYTGVRQQFVQASLGETTIALSSNMLTPEWARWWAYEPLRSRRAWIYIHPTSGEGVWAPCILKPDGDAVIADHEKGTYEIKFTAVLDWEGAMI